MGVKKSRRQREEDRVAAGKQQKCWVCNTRQPDVERCPTPLAAEGISGDPEKLVNMCRSCRARLAEEV